MKQTKLMWQDVERQVHELLRQMCLEQWRPDYVVGLTRGGLTPAVLISQYLNVPMHALKVSLRDGQGDCESNLWMAEEAFGYVNKEDRGEIVAWSNPAARRNILIVDDINDSGATINWLKQDWEAGCMGTVAPGIWKEIWGSNVRFAMLVNNESSEFKDVNYAAQTVNKLEDPQWIVFPWEEWWQ